MYLILNNSGFFVLKIYFFVLYIFFSNKEMLLKIQIFTFVILNNLIGIGLKNNDIFYMWKKKV